MIRENNNINIISIISFTKAGRELSKKIKNRLLKEEIKVNLYCKSEKYKDVSEDIKLIKNSLYDWTKNQFEKERAIIFIGACAIAVRMTAPLLKSKLKDVPVLVIDERGQFVIPILSGHYKGANELAYNIANKLEATAVVTTASDINGLFAIDVFARKNNLIICNKEGIKKVSSAILAKEAVTILSEENITGTVPQELTIIKKDFQIREVSVLISPYRRNEIKAKLKLCPSVFIIGIGCKKGKSFEELKKAVKKQLKISGISIEAVSGIASIDIKKDEKGLCKLAKKYQLPFLTFSKEELMKVSGSYIASSFVMSKVGVDNVCERAAMAACKGEGTLVVNKQAKDGITIAIAMKNWSVCFDEI